MLHDPFSNEDDGGGTLFRDMITLALGAFLLVVVLLLPHINPPGEKQEELAKPPGNIMIEIIWPPKVDADVDLWVQAPGDVPVGYSNKGGQVFNLLRDDLGFPNDATGLNYENSYTRGIVKGEYTVNLHLYRASYARDLPIPVRIVVSVKRENATNAVQILASTVNLTKVGQEKTIFRFKMDEEGFLVPNSIHSLYKPLRSAAGDNSFDFGTPGTGGWPSPQ